MIIPAIFANFFVFENLIVPGDAATTAYNIMANELLFRSGTVMGTVQLTMHLLILTISYNKVNLIEITHPCIPVASHTQA